MSKKIEILISTALINQSTDQWAGLHERVDASDERADYLVGIGAARYADDEPKKSHRKPASGDESAPKKPEAPEAPRKAPEPAAPPRRPAAPVRKPLAK